MRHYEALHYVFHRLRALVHHAVEGLDAEALAWRPGPEANSIAWLVWHLTRVEDDHVADIAGVEQRWTASGWAARFDLPVGFTDIGYGHSSDDVARIRPVRADLLVDYHDEVAAMVQRYLENATDDDAERIIDTSYDPPVTVGIRLLSVIQDTLQHVGQAAYVRGLLRP